MKSQPWIQLSPNPDLDPGFRLDPRGRARFLVQGYAVDVAVTYLNDEDSKVEVKASVKLYGVKVAELSTLADWDEYYTLRDALDSLLNNVVNEARNKVSMLAEHVAKVESQKN